MLTDPYPRPTTDDDADCMRLQTYISKEDKSLLMCLRPVRGTLQTITNILINNLCHDLRDLGIQFFTTDADAILAVLLQRRQFNDEQVGLLRRTSVGVSKEIPTGLQQPKRSTSVRERPTSHSTGSDDPSSKTARGKQRVGEATSDPKKSAKGTTKTKTNSGGHIE